MPKEAQRYGLQPSIRVFSKIFCCTWAVGCQNFGQYITYVMPWTVYFGWICSSCDLGQLFFGIEEDKKFQTLILFKNEECVSETHFQCKLNFWKTANIPTYCKLLGRRKIFHIAKVYQLSLVENVIQYNTTCLLFMHM